jgi:hypothetical protein
MPRLNEDCSFDTSLGKGTSTNYTINSTPFSVPIICLYMVEWYSMICFEYVVSLLLYQANKSIYVHIYMFEYDMGL